MRWSPVLAVTAAVFALACAAPHAQAVIHDVAWDGSGDFDTIQEGIDAASDGDTVLVAPGTYAGDGNRDLLLGSKRIVLRGTPESPGETVIDCGNETGHRGIRFLLGAQDSTCVVDGFLIKRGLFTDVNSSGAGISCEWASPKLVNLRLEENRILGGGNGGGLYCSNSASPIVRNVSFLWNSAYNGGGMYCSMGSSPRIRNATFTENTATSGPGRGGGIYCGSDAPPSLADVVFSGNVAGREGGGMYCWRSSPELDRVTFVGNSGLMYGGGLSCDDDCSPMLTNVTFSANSAPEGGAIYLVDNSSPFVSRSILAFSENGGAISCDGTCDPTIMNSCVYGNAGGDDVCGSPTNIITQDPLFCDVTADDLGLAANSPCLSGGNPWTVHMGSHDQACTTSPVEEASWGRIKSLYR